MNDYFLKRHRNAVSTDFNENHIKYYVYFAFIVDKLMLSMRHHSRDAPNVLSFRAPRRDAVLKLAIGSCSNAMCSRRTQVSGNSCVLKTDVVCSVPMVPNCGDIDFHM